MESDDLLRAGIEEARAQRERIKQATRAHQEEAATKQDRWDALVAGGVALLQRFLAVMRHAGNPGLRRHRRLFGTSCWEMKGTYGDSQWLAPSGYLRWRGSDRWEAPSEWIRRSVSRTEDEPGSNWSGPGQIIVPDREGLTRLGNEFGRILEANGVDPD